MKFDFEDEILMRKINFFFFSFLTILLFLNLAMHFFRGQLYFVKPVFTQEEMVLNDICYYGLKSILDKNPHAELLTKENYKALIQSKFTIFNYDTINFYGKPKILGDLCFISVKNNKGLIAFKVKLKKTNSDYGYVISDVEEIETSLYKKMNS